MSVNIFIGDTQISKIYIGSNEISKIYVGDTIVLDVAA